MKLSELNTRNSEVSATASTQARTLGLAGLAIVWLFASPFFQRAAGAVEPSPILYAAGSCLALSLALDLIQLYVRAGLLNAAFTREQERLQPELKAGEDPQVGSLGRMLQITTATLFYAKAIPLLVGYILLLVFFVGLA